MEFDLTIDKSNLDQEILDHPQKVYEINRLAALAEKKRDEAEFNLKVVEAELEKEGREILSKTTEGAVKNFVRTHPHYIQALKECLDTNAEFKNIQAGVIAFSHRKMALENLIKLFLSNYYAEPYDSDLENRLIDNQINKQQTKVTETLRRRRIMGKFDRNRLKSGIKDSIEYSNKTKDSKGGGSKSPLDWDALEEAGYVKYSPNPKKTNYISVIPYLPSDADPRQGSIQESKRKSTHFLDFWTHKIANSGDIYVCPQNTYGEPCPMCEKIKAQRGKMDRRYYWYELRPIRRALYAIFDELEPDGFVKSWYIPYNIVEKKIKT